MMIANNERYHLLKNSLRLSIWVLLTFYAWNAFATHRYAIVIGANKGDPSEAPLFYAQRDAQRISKVLLQIGNFKKKNIFTLIDVKSSAIEDAFAAINKRIGDNEDSMIFIYFSGHADMNSIHLNGTQYGFLTLKKKMKASKASLRVLVIDACKSGEITRVKGAGPAKAFNIDASKWKSGHGMAIITSSAAGEDAQESDRLKAGFFTHYFIAGLRGAADASGDKDISLSEVYDYVYKETLRATSAAQFVQHPTYAFDIRGRKDVTLTRINSNPSIGYLKVNRLGKYLFFKDHRDGDLAFEIHVEKPLELALTPGKYFVRRREDYKLYEGEVVIASSMKTQLGDLERVQKMKIARKGEAEESNRWGLLAGAGMGKHAIKEIGFSPFFSAGLRLDFGRLTSELRFRFHPNEQSGAFIKIDQQIFSLDLSLSQRWTFSEFSLGLGVRAMGGILHQSFPDSTNEDNRVAFIGSAGPLAIIGYTFYDKLQLDLRAGGDAIILPRFEAQDLAVSLSPYGELNVTTFF